MSIRLNTAAGLLAASRRGAPARRRRRPDEAPPLPRHRRRPGRLLLRGRHLDGARPSGGTADPAHRPPRPRALPEVLPGREVARLHRPVRGRRAGLRDARPRAARRSSSPTTRPAAPSPRATATTTRWWAGRPTARAILFRSQRDADGIRSEGQLFTVPAKGGLAKALPMPTSGAGDFSPDGKRIAYSPLFRDFRTWKRYEGGWAQDLYVYDLATNEAKPFATSLRTERDPMWIGDADLLRLRPRRHAQPVLLRPRDRGGREAHHAARPGTCAGRPPTTSPASSTSWTASCTSSTSETRADQAISIFVPNDGVAMRPSRHSAEKNVEDFELSPKGERALFVARGDVFTAARSRRARPAT